MPAQTHSRVRNGFHILANSRGRLTNLNGPPCNTAAQCEKAYCCGPAIQPLSSKPRGCRRGLCSFTPNRGRKRALALGGVGSRSAATKRAISRRVENRNKMAAGYVPSATRPRNATEWPTKNATCKTPCPCCLITMTKNHPRNSCLGSCARKSNSPNSLLTASSTSAASSSATAPVASGPVSSGSPPGAPSGPVSSGSPPGAPSGSGSSGPPLAVSALGTTPGNPPYNTNPLVYQTVEITLNTVINAGNKIKIEAVPSNSAIDTNGEIEFTVAETLSNTDYTAPPGVIYTQPFKSGTTGSGNTIITLTGTQGDLVNDPPAAVFPGTLFSLFPVANPLTNQNTTGLASIKVRVADSSGTYPEAATTLTVTQN